MLWLYKMNIMPNSGRAALAKHSMRASFSRAFFSQLACGEVNQADHELASLGKSFTKTDGKGAHDIFYASVLLHLLLAPQRISTILDLNDS